MTLCPLCRSTVVATPTWSFSDTRVQVETCPDCRDRTATLAVTMKVSAVMALETPTEVLRHSEGLVTFR